MKISTLSPVTSQKKANTKIPGKKFWEYLRIGKTIEPLLFINLNEEGYTSHDTGRRAGTRICIKKMFEYLPLFKVNYESKQPDDLTKDALDKAITGKQVKMHYGTLP